MPEIIKCEWFYYLVYFHATSTILLWIKAIIQNFTFCLKKEVLPAQSFKEWNLLCNWNDDNAKETILFRSNLIWSFFFCNSCFLVAFVSNVKTANFRRHESRTWFRKKSDSILVKRVLENIFFSGKHLRQHY